ncbi:MAG: dihydrolipoyl dehydrogenase [Candidatus Atribacteria bacterium]|nr:dihydrolipoyl dehydrogenase [Candidatus Atribacteria bacterium]
MREVEVLVIGGGPAGYASALRAGQKGLKTILVEGRDLGGTCLNRGCIPTKAFFKSQEVAHFVRRAHEFGVKAEYTGIDWPTVLSRKNRIVRQLTSGVGFLLKKARVEVVEGWASFLDPHTVQVTRDGRREEEIRAKSIILASGSQPATLPVEGADFERVIDSERALELPELPSSMVVIGGGVIGMEMACIFNAFGVKVEVIEMMPKILPPVDGEVTALLTQIVEKRGLVVHLRSRVQKIQNGSNALQVVFTDAEGKERIAEGEYVLVATGRMPHTEGLNLENIGIKLEGKAVFADETLRTSLPWIYAPGDVNGRYLLAHVAYKEAEVALENILGGARKMDYRYVPNCIFSFPEIASVGFTEEEAGTKGYEVRIGKFPFRANGKALIEGETEGFVKVISEKRSGEILGVHIIGPHASDLITEAVLAMNMECTPEEVAQAIHAHPTLSESVMEAAEAVFGLPLHFT